MNFCSKEVILEQIEHLRGVARQPGVDLHILPQFQPIDVLPVTGFDIIDSNLVLIETRGMQLRVWDEEDVLRYIHDFDSLRNCATQTPVEAEAILDGIRERVEQSWQ